MRHGQKELVGLQGIAHHLESRTVVVGPKSYWVHSRSGHVGERGPSRRWGGQEGDQVAPGEDMGNHHRPRRQEVPGGRIVALAVAACVREAPVCFGCDFGCGFRGGREDPVREQRGAKTLAVGESP